MPSLAMPMKASITIFRDLLKEAWQLIEAWRREYNESRPHASLADRTPREFASQYAANRVLAGT